MFFEYFLACLIWQTVSGFSFNLTVNDDKIQLNSSLLKQEINDVSKEQTLEPWSNWPHYMLPHNFETQPKKYTWTVITKLKTTVSDYKTISDNEVIKTTISPQELTLKPNIDLSSNFLKTSTPKFYDNSKSSNHLQPQSSFSYNEKDLNNDKTSLLSSFLDRGLKSSNNLITASYILHSSVVTNDFYESLSDNLKTSSVIYYSIQPNLLTPSLIIYSNSIEVETLNETSNLNLLPTVIKPTASSLFNIINQTSMFLNNDTQDYLDNNFDKEVKEVYLYKSVLSFKKPSKGIDNLTIDFENKFSEILKLASLKLTQKRSSDLNVQIINLNWKELDKTRIVSLIYNVKNGETYLNPKLMNKLMSKISNEEFANIFEANETIIKYQSITISDSLNDNQTIEPVVTEPTNELNKILSDAYFKMEWTYFWIIILILAILILLCCFFCGMFVYWYKQRLKKQALKKKIAKEVNRMSPISAFSSDTLGSEKFLNWRSKPKRGKSIFSNEFKTETLNKFKKKEIGSSPSNEFEYISFNSDTSNSSLNRNDSLNNKKQNRHHPYNQTSLNHDLNQRTLQKKNYSKNSIGKNQSGIKLLVSRGVQNDLLNFNEEKSIPIEKKSIPLEKNSVSFDKSSIPLKKNSIDFDKNNFQKNISVLKIDKKKLVPLDTKLNNENLVLKKSNQFNKNIDENLDKKPLRLPKEEPKRLIKRKEIIEEFETITTTTTFKSDPNKELIFKNYNDFYSENKSNVNLNDQTKDIISAIRDELKKFNLNKNLPNARY